MLNAFQDPTSGALHATDHHNQDHERLERMGLRTR